MLTDGYPKEPAEQEQQQGKAEGENNHSSPLQKPAAACGPTQLAHHGHIDLINGLLASERLLDEVVELLVGKHVIDIFFHNISFYDVSNVLNPFR